MKKITCPQCGVVNLEKFVTFPNCAGCGSQLAQSEAAQVPVAAWRQPLRAWLWATLIGGAAIGLVVASKNLQPTSADLGQIVIYGQAPRIVPVGGKLAAQLTLDMVAAPNSGEEEQLRDIRLRLPRDFFKAFDLLSLQPRPDTDTTIGSGRYFNYAVLERDSRLQLQLRARRAGRYHLDATLQARGQNSGEYHALITVAR